MDKTYTRINWQNEPSVATPINDVNLNKMDYSLNEVDNRIIVLDNTKADESEVQQLLESVTYNSTTGVFVFTWKNGTTLSVDLNIEKIPVSFSMSPQGVITMTTADGTEYTADVSELIKIYSFADSSEIDFTVTTDASGNKTVTAGIVAGSITGDKLQPNYLADCVTAKNGAESAAGSASSSATSSELSSEDSEAWAIGERNGQPVPSTDPAYENNAKWWAQHGTGSSFAGLTDTNFTNLQGGQIAKYDDVTQKWVNTEDEGGLLPHFKITSEAGSTVTVVCPDTSVITPTQTSSGIWQCDVPAYGVYTVHAVINGDDAVRTVTVDTVKEYVIHDEHYSYTLNVYAPTGSSIIVTDGGSETYTGTGAGSTAVIFALHQASTQYTITVTYDGLTRTDSVTSSATSGQSGSKTIEFGTINLTLDEDLIGETIVMTNGTDTVSKIASSTSMVFYPNTTGNWTISCQYDGETYYSEPNPVVVSSLSTAVSAEISLVHIPEGATVTPTDDIQTWLACANITDKSYTTLAEVLADRETFETLIADSNACDYMARSTTWALAEGAVPTMTSNTTPSGECSGSSIEGANYDYYCAFTESTTYGWCCQGSEGWGNAYVQYEFPMPKIINRWRVKEAGTAYNKIIKLQGSNDGSTFTDLSTSDAISSNDTYYYYSFNNTTAYKYYRIVLVSGNNSPNYGQGIRAQLYEADITTSETAMRLIGKYDYCSNALLGNATWAEAIANSDYWNSVCNVSVPKMTSNTTPSGQASASATYTVAGYEAYRAFDRDNSTRWAGTTVGSSGSGTLTYMFPSAVKILYARIQTMSGMWLGSASIQGSNDGSTWSQDLWSLTTEDTSDCFAKLNNDTDYKYYRLSVTTQSTSSNLAHPSIMELQFFGRNSVNATNTNGIIHTANGDTVTCNGNTYVADTNGIIDIDFSDFDEGTYTFTSGIAKDPTNLSNYYSKSFKITKSPYGGTTELYLMPDAVKTLYWYGYMSDDCEELSTANGWTCRTSWSWKSPTYNTNDILLSSGSSGQYYYTGIGSKNKIPLSSVVKAVGTGLSVVASACMFISNFNNGKTIPNDAYEYAYWDTTNLEELKTLTTTIEDYITAVTWVAGRSGKLNALWYE